MSPRTGGESSTPKTTTRRWDTRSIVFLLFLYIPQVSRSTYLHQGCETNVIESKPTCTLHHLTLSEVPLFSPPYTSTLTFSLYKRVTIQSRRWPGLTKISPPKLGRWSCNRSGQRVSCFTYHSVHKDISNVRITVFVGCCTLVSTTET